MAGKLECRSTSWFGFRLQVAVHCPTGGLLRGIPTGELPVRDQEVRWLIPECQGLACKMGIVTGLGERRGYACPYGSLTER